MQGGNEGLGTGRLGRRAAIAALALGLTLAAWLARADQPSHAATPTGTSVIVLIGDGMGPAQRAATQLARYGLDVVQPMDALPVSGTMFTQSTSTITDSAAAATAIATGTKTRNGRIGIGPNGERLETLLEIARDQGKATGLVEDSDVTNATTGSFASHVKDRSQRRTMARQYLYDTRPDVILGGGEQFWYKRGTKGAIPNDYPDDRNRANTDLVAEAQALGYQYANDAEGIAALTGPKALGLVQQDAYVREILTGGEYDHKKDPHYVPEEVLVGKALEILSQDPDGFFLAIDVDEIDAAGHGSHAGLVIKSADLLNRIVQTIEAYRATDPNLLFVVTADHETGGMTIEGPTNNSTSVRGFPVPNRWRNGPFQVEGSSRVFTTDWTTPGHTGIPVPLTAAGPGSERLDGPNDNTEVFQVAKDVLTGAP